MAAVVHDLTPALELRAKLLDLLSRRPRDLVEVAQRLPEYEVETLRHALHILANAGHIERVRCRYQVVEEASGDGPNAA